LNFGSEGQQRRGAAIGNSPQEKASKTYANKARLQMPEFVALGFFRHFLKAF